MTGKKKKKTVYRDTEPERQPSNRWFWATASILLVLHLGLGFFSLKDKSPTVDEFAHLPAGAYYWLTGDFSLYGKNPPLVKLWCGWPLLAAGAKVQTKDRYEEVGDWRPWVYGTRFMRDNQVDYQRLFILGRLPNLVLSLGLGLVVLFWARELFGPTGGLIALSAYSLSPNILAHARLATMDLGMSLFWALTLFLFWRFLKNPKFGRAAWVGLALGLANLTKFSALLLLPLLPALWLIRVFSAPQEEKKRLFLRGLAGLAGSFLVALIVINAGYGFRGTPTDIRAMAASSQSFQTLAAGPLGSCPWPAPRDYLVGLDRQKKDAEAGVFPNYLNGEFNQKGWRHYFSYAWLVKTPAAVEAALVLALGLWLVRRRSGSIDLIFLGLPIALLWVVLSFFNHINAGLRYFLPAQPLIFIFLGSLGRVNWLTSWKHKAAAAALTGFFVLESLGAFPHYLAAFNPLWVKRSEARFHLLDSNLDWGQDLVHLKKFMDRRGLSQVALAYFGHADPKIYGINYELAGETPTDEPVAVSANLVMGLPYLLTYVNPPVWVAPETFAWLRDRRPEAQVGYSILVYNLPK